MTNNLFNTKLVSRQFRVTQNIGVANDLFNITMVSEWIWPTQKPILECMNSWSGNQQSNITMVIILATFRQRVLSCTQVIIWWRICDFGSTTIMRMYDKHSVNFPVLKPSDFKKNTSFADYITSVTSALLGGTKIHVQAHHLQCHHQLPGRLSEKYQKLGCLHRR